MILHRTKIIEDYNIIAYSQWKTETKKTIIIWKATKVEMEHEIIMIQALVVSHDNKNNNMSQVCARDEKNKGQ